MISFRWLAVVAMLAFARLSGAVASEDTTEKLRPVTKVITLLKDMLKQLDVEKEKDKEIYENMVCWCKNNDKVKVKSIADAEARIKDLKNMIEEYVARIAQLKIEIEDLETQIAKDRAVLKKAKAMREKEIAEFEAEEAELLLTIQTLVAAAKAIEEHQSMQFLQLSSSTLKAVADKVQAVMQNHDGVLKSTFTPSQRRVFSSFIQLANRETAKSKSDYHPEYAPQSGEIFGMLEQMKETFQQNLDKLQEEEKVNQKAYVELKTAKEAEIEAAMELVATKEKIITETEVKLADARQELADLEKVLAEDQDFLAKLKEKCALSDKEYEARTIARNDEITAVTEALTILTDDDAQDTFARTFNSAASFLQLASTQQSKQRRQALNVISKVADKFHNPKLSALVLHARLDAFTEVKKDIDEMVKQLLQQKADEIVKRESCINMINDNELAQSAQGRKKTDLESRIAVLENEIKDLEDEIKAEKIAIKALMLELKIASENRDKESKEFQATLADQHATVKLLQSALKVLEKDYGKAEAASAVGRDAGDVFLQRSRAGQPSGGGPAPPELYENKALEKRDSGVMRLISIIIKDAETMSVESKKAESDAAATYETIAQETKKSVDTKLATIANKEAVKASTEADLIQNQKDLEETETEIDNLKAANRDLHGECDYILKNFEIRQQARDEEVEALNEAKAILSGADFTDYYYKNPNT